MFINPPTFSNETPNKIGNGIEVLGKNTLMNTNTDLELRVAIADEPINAKVDGKKIFCVSVQSSREEQRFGFMMIGLTTVETFDSTLQARFEGGLSGVGLGLCWGHFFDPEKQTNIINRDFSMKANEIIVILTVSNNGEKKEIRFFL